MRLQLSLATAALAIAGGSAGAEPARDAGAWGSVRLYLDDDHVTVVSPSASATAPVGADSTLTVDTTADAISSASIDVLSSASPIAIREVRLELGVEVGHELDPGALRGHARVSHEEDYLSLRAGAAIRAELRARTLTLELGYQGGVDRVGDVTDPGFERRRTSHQLTLTAGQVLDRRTQLDVIADAQLASGYHASPYRLVPVDDPAWPLPMWVDEQTPRLRRGVALTARARRAVTDTWFVAAGQRAYLDDWSMTSHTTTVEARHQLDDRWLLGVVLRGYLQRGADFYRRRYAGVVPDERTRDRTLGPMRTLFASITADRAVGESGSAHLVMACGVLSMWFLESALQAERRALLTTVSVTYAF